ncbi:MAG: Fe-S cluster assembly protein SufD [Candidatus Binatia bacterium]
MTQTPELDRHLEHYRRRADAMPAAARALRERGVARFHELGFPTTQLEDWKYTNPSAITRRAFDLPAAGIPDAAAARVAATRLRAGIELVFVNGRYAAELSSTAALPAGAFIGSLRQALEEQPELVARHLGALAAPEQDGVLALNTAFIEDGACIVLPESVALDVPVHCLFASAAGDTATVSHVRSLIVAGPRSRASVIEHYVGDGAYWTNAVTEIAVGRGAELTHYAVQREDPRAYHLATIAAAQAGESRFTSSAVAFGGALSRRDIGTRFDAAGAACTFDGLYMAGESRHVDHHTTIDHRAPEGTSRELYKGILSGRATGVFNGKVFVRPDAQRSDARQMNQNLLLSDDAQIDTKPQLEIFADDVKCSHGATIGQLDEDAVFYLQSRGLDPADAQRLLIYAFANELLARIDILPLREQLEAAMGDQLRAALGAQP